MPSKRRKCRRPDASPATIVMPSGAKAQLINPLSPVKQVISLPISKSQTLRVLSEEADSAYLPLQLIATAFTESR